MTRDQIRDLITARLGSRTDLNTEVESYITHVQETVLEGDPQFLPWFLATRQVSSMTLAAAASTTALPSAFLRELDEGQVYAYPTASPTKENIKEVEKVVRDIMPGTFASDEDAGNPRQYSLFNLTMVFDRKADQEYTLIIPAYLRDTALSGGSSSNNWTVAGAEWLIAEVLIKMASRLGNQRVLKEAQADARVARSRLMGLDAARENAGADYVMTVGEER